MMAFLAVGTGLLLCLYLTDGNQAKNLAWKKFARQSTTLGQYTADKAVDGLKSDADFSHTLQTGIRWWRVDLGEKYSIGQIKLYNRKTCCRKRLAKITTLTSTVDNPAVPSLTSDDWVTRAYREPAYADVGIIDIKPSVRARHVAVYSSLDPAAVGGKGALALLEVEVFAQANLAHNKTASQGSTTANAVAEYAVNGIYTDFSETATDTGKWWRVDLEKKYSIGAIELYTDSPLKQISILTSNHESPGAPSNEAADWNKRNFQKQQHEEFIEIKFTAPVEGRHIAIISNNSGQPLKLAEVVVSEYNYARSQTTIQSTTNSQRTSRFAVDGDLATRSQTLSRSNQWWMVDVRHLILLKRVEVFVRNGRCNSGAIECSSRLYNWFFLTNNANTNAAPSATGSGGWETCYSSSAAQGDSYKIKCSSNQTPLTRLFSILPTNGYAVELREVEIFGHELAQLTEETYLNTENSTYTSIVISFLQWSELMTGVQPPSRYVVRVKKHGKSIMILESPHTLNGARFQHTFGGLAPGQQYEISVSCVLEDSITCSGVSPSYLISTQACTEPAVPALSFTNTKTIRESIEIWMYNYSWEAPDPKCFGSVTYTCSKPGAVNQSTVERFATFLINGNVEFEFTVTSENKAGLRSVAFSRQRSPPLAPQFGHNEMQLHIINDGCIELNWREPEFPGGDDIIYEFKCGDRDWQTTKALYGDSCGHPPSSNITCIFRAANGLLVSKELFSFGQTKDTAVMENMQNLSPALASCIAILCILSLLIIIFVTTFIIYKRHKEDRLSANQDAEDAVSLDYMLPRPAPIQPAEGASETQRMQVRLDNELHESEYSKIDGADCDPTYEPVGKRNSHQYEDC